MEDATRDLIAIMSDKNQPIRKRWTAMMDYEGWTSDDARQLHTKRYMEWELNTCLHEIHREPQ